MFLEYMIEATEDIMSLMIIMGVIFAYVALKYTKIEKRIFHIFVIAGVGAALWMAIMKNATNRTSGTSVWNLRIYTISFISFAAFLIFTIIESALAKKGKKLKISVACIALSVYAFQLLFLVLPNFIAYPYTLKVAETTVFSSSYIIKLSGVITGFVLTLVAAFASNRMGKRLGMTGCTVYLLAVMIINQVQQFGGLLSALLNNHIIASLGHTLFQMTVYIVNHTTLFTYLIMAAAVVAAVVMLIRSAHVNEPYNNNAQHRKIRAKWRLIRKWAVTSLSTVALAVLLMTAINSVVNAEVTMSPTEDATIDGDNVVVNFDQVSDGHLHRFGYTTENNIQVRFIVIQKPNSTTYGVGMDCCDICGETGYYENRAGDVVCSRCNVIMNINTIGFKGGCNPKVVDYTVANNQIIIPIEQLTQYEKDFKNARGTGSVNS